MDEGDYDDPTALLNEIKQQRRQEEQVRESVDSDPPLSCSADPPDPPPSSGSSPPPAKPPRGRKVGDEQSRPNGECRNDPSDEEDRNVLLQHGSVDPQDGAVTEPRSRHALVEKVVEKESLCLRSCSTEEEEDEAGCAKQGGGARLPTKIKSTEGRQEMWRDKLVVKGSIPVVASPRGAIVTRSASARGFAERMEGREEQRTNASFKELQKSRAKHLEQQGIHQGFANVDDDRTELELGIVPDSVAMTARLEESMQGLEFRNWEPVVVPEVPDLPPSCPVPPPPKQGLADIFERKRVRMKAWEEMDREKS